MLSLVPVKAADPALDPATTITVIGADGTSKTFNADDIATMPTTSGLAAMKKVNPPILWCQLFGLIQVLVFNTSVTKLAAQQLTAQYTPVHPMVIIGTLHILKFMTEYLQ